MKDNEFYHAFQNRYRGSRELVKSRLRVYLPFVESLCSFYLDAKAIDLGCGRGEWLELLKASGFDAQGVDLDDIQLASCRELGLNVHAYDAVSFLKKMSDSSQVVITGFHIVEHIPFPDLQELVQEALRILKPGGLLILETPNPENIVTGTTNFYIDPTHKHPIPPQLLSFLPEYYGFKKVKILRLQEPAELFNRKFLNLLDVLNGVSPDYSVVAQKTGDAEILAVTNLAFEVEYGHTLEKLASRYYQYIENNAQQAETRAQETEVRVQQVEVRSQQAEVVAQEAQMRAQQSETAARQVEDLVLKYFYNEKTPLAWFLRRNSKPTCRDVIAAYRCFLRREPENMAVVFDHMKRKTVGEMIDFFKASEEFKGRTKQEFLSSPFAITVHFLRAHPFLKGKVKNWIGKYPALEKRLRMKAIAQGLIIKQTQTKKVPSPRIDSLPLTPFARTIYDDLKKKIQEQKKRNI